VKQHQQQQHQQQQQQQQQHLTIQSPIISIMSVVAVAGGTGKLGRAIVDALMSEWDSPSVHLGSEGA